MRHLDDDLSFLAATARTVRAGITVLALLTLAQYAAGLTVPWLSGRLTAALVKTGGIESAAIDLLFASLALALLAQAVLGIASVRQNAKLQMTLTASLQVRVYGHLQTLPLGFFHTRRTGALLSLLTYDAAQVAGFASSALGPAAPHVLTFSVALALMMQIDWILGGAAGLAVPLFFLAAKLFMRRIRPLSVTFSESHGLAAAHAESHLGAMLLIKAFNCGPSSTAEYAREVRRMSDLGQRVTMALGRVQPGLNLLAGLFAVGLVWLLTDRFTAGALGPGELVSFLMYGYFLARPMSQLAAVYGQLQHARASAGRICEVLDAAPEQPGQPGCVLTAVRGEIEFRDVRFAYPDRPAALDGVNLHIRAGERVALVGENGAGKTTLAQLLLRFADPDAGEIRLDGTPLRAIDLKSLRAHIGLVPQTVLLLDGSIAENIAFGRKSASPERIEAAARIAEAHAFIEDLPRGYGTPVGERGVRLSGGQQQRLALARALLDHPPVLILDEATAQLDPQTEMRFLESVKRSFDDRTVLLITHRPAALAVADRIVHLSGGRVVLEERSKAVGSLF